MRILTVRAVSPSFLKRKPKANDTKGGIVQRLQEDVLDMLPHFESRDKNAIQNIKCKFEEIKGKRFINKDLSTNFPIEWSKAKRCYTTSRALMEEMSILYADDKYCDKVFEQNKMYAEKLLEVTIRFKEILDKMKADDNVMCFGDLEHGAVKLIDSGVDIGEDYDYVFVDEYQDVNGAQEYIISHLIKKEAFMVSVCQTLKSFLQDKSITPKTARMGKLNHPSFSRIILEVTMQCSNLSTTYLTMQ